MKAALIALATPFAFSALYVLWLVIGGAYYDRKDRRAAMRRNT